MGKKSLFSRYIGLDYSGAKTAESKLTGLCVFAAKDASTPEKISPSRGRSTLWSRQELAQWLEKELSVDSRIIVGIDHAFSFPLSYFQRYKLENWDDFLVDFCRHWPLDRENTTVDSLRTNNPRSGSPMEFRLCERWTSSAKSVFAFDVPGQVAKSTHAGIPWLYRLRKKLISRVHFWPFDGFEIGEENSVVLEVYPSIIRNRYPAEGRNKHEQDAYAVAKWLQDMDHRGMLNRYFLPPITESERSVAMKEGWILGIA